MAPTVLAARGVAVSFGAQCALQDASLDVAEGQSVAVVGQSGSGKSTFLHALAGLIVPDKGSVTLGGVDVVSASDAERTRLRRERLGFVLQHGQLVPELTLGQNAAMPLRLLGESRRHALAKVMPLLESLGVAHLASRLPGEVSGGEQQRVAVARALCARPAVVFADEPTGALDSANGAVVADALWSSAREAGAAVVLVTHDAGLAAMADRVVTMSDGRTHEA